MKRYAFAALLVLLLFGKGFGAPPGDPNTPWPPGTGTVSQGVTSAGVQHPIQVDANGVVQTNSAGGSISANVNINQTTPGTTNGVQTLSGSVENSTLQAGSAIVGKVGIDQTTPGTTNGVQVNAALPAGTNTIGNANTGALLPSGATQVISSHTFSAGASNNTTTIAGVSAQYSCLEQAIIHMDVSTAVVTGDVTISDGTWTVHIKCVDTTSAGAWCPYDGPVLQSSAVNTTITVTVPAMTNGGAGDSMAVGYTRAGGC